MRRAGLDRQITPLIQECNGKGGDARVYAPIDIITQEDEPTTEQISEATGEQEVSPMLHRLVRHLHAKSKHSPQLKDLMNKLVQPTTQEEIDKVTAGWASKAVGITGFRSHLMALFPAEYRQLFVTIVNAVLTRGVCMTTLCEILLSQLKKPDGGHRGIALSEDIMKLVLHTSTICIVY